MLYFTTKPIHLNQRLLRETFRVVPPYLQVEEGKGFAGLPWFSALVTKLDI